jgi:poly(hydroxyalkanoate) depolymerase family esterase
MTRLTNLAETVSRLTAQRKAMAAAAADLVTEPGVLRPAPVPARNPGALAGWAFVPDRLPPRAPLVVVLHGCTQNAALFDHGSGWSALAAEAGFALLYPEQTRQNNPNLCFNWFAPDDVTRGRGEVESIRQMVAAMVAAHDLDPARVFITGLSAGGAMTAAMLATSPEVFAGGAIVAGIAHGVAASVNEGLERMRGSGLPDAEGVAALVRSASPHRGAWPRLSVWQGTADDRVDAVNAEAISAGWAALHGLGAPEQELVAGHPRRVWRDADGCEIIESFIINGMGHGAPITAKGAEACGNAAPHMLEAGISSTRRIAAFWGIAPLVAQPEARPTAAGPAAARPTPPFDLGDVINGALRRAGLLR